MATKQREPGKVERIASEIREKIERGTLAPGSRLPGVPQLQQEHGIAYQTARDIYGLLEDEGLVFSRRGKGTYVSLVIDKIVSDRTIRYQPGFREAGGAVGAFEAEMRAKGFDFKNVVTIAKDVPPKKVTGIFEMHHRAKTLKRERVMSVFLPGNAEALEVVQVATSWFPADVVDACPALGSVKPGTGGSKSRMVEAGFAQVRLREEIEVRSPTREEAAALGIAAEQAVMEITHMGLTAEGRVVEICLHVLPRAKWRLSYEWAIDAPGTG
ncbi:GntR family transcriptional regulator [Streptomyces anulatus]|uniref:GntR family transcriptional regulator n=1 Tax=Streptomyces anulatus TaxID=1892 RepID=UPI00224EFDC0|nr:GntR family transcriptional regulator [Streptomyces anulatus]MCX4489797.1 GntR family transcriptional regulator [Streptomyces anulatus]MCX4489840.1 GntR family transcriptional regulator [Streptomyces anulatus]MCX4523680.1 GntR family transcriptional regulator [Streptomyces anulatus]MCX4523809.1 GntR family transcriptional regulator [Streptomyces anulatus]MCX4606681.1 GntR family transcriptional regulator [Streptomyces anulatus]